MLEELLGKGLLAYVGLALLPTPPSPVPDAGSQFALSLFLGILAPKGVAHPFASFFQSLGRGAVMVFGLVPGLSLLVERLDTLYDKWVGWISKKRESDNRILNKLYGALGREDLVERLIFGYFCTIAMGSVLIVLSVLL